MKKSWYWLLFGTKGARTRVRIIKKIRERPSNINQIAVALGMDYKTNSYYIKN